MKVEFLKPESWIEPFEPALGVKKVLVPIDFSAPSRTAFRYALGFARQFGSEIVLVHVLAPDQDLPDGQCEVDMKAREADAEKELQALANSSPLSGKLYITSTILTGSPTHEIVEAAKQFDVDLIITATHGLRGWKHFGLGSTSDRVARAAPCPVLVVREKEHEFV